MRWEYATFTRIGPLTSWCDGSQLLEENNEDLGTGKKLKSVSSMRSNAWSKGWDPARFLFAKSFLVLSGAITVSVEVEGQKIGSKIQRHFPFKKRLSTTQCKHNEQGHSRRGRGDLDAHEDMSGRSSPPLADAALHPPDTWRIQCGRCSRIHKIVLTTVSVFFLNVCFISSYDHNWSHYLTNALSCVVQCIIVPLHIIKYGTLVRMCLQSMWKRTRRLNKSPWLRGNAALWRKRRG